MKIAVTAVEGRLDSTIDPRFGRCAYFLIVEVEGDKIKRYEAIKNPAINAIGGAGIQAAQLVASKNVEVVIAGNIGPNAFNVLTTANIKIITGVSGITVKDAVEKYLKGELKETSIPSTPIPFPSNIQPAVQRGRFRGPPMECICPACGFRIVKQRRIPCAQHICPNCGSPMVRA